MTTLELTYMCALLHSSRVQFTTSRKKYLLAIFCLCLMLFVDIPIVCHNLLMSYDQLNSLLHPLEYQFTSLLIVLINTDWFCNLFFEFGAWQSDLHDCHGVLVEETGSSIGIPQVCTDHISFTLGYILHLFLLFPKSITRAFD